MSDKCQRCGERGEDRRTLYMACLYAMHELGLPFKQLAIQGEVLRHTGSKKKNIGILKGIRVDSFSKPTNKKSDRYEHRFYTMLVCKKCRADWMHAIKDWFENSVPNPPSCGSGIFVRENGACKEITEQEWYTKHPGQEPFRVIK